MIVIDASALLEVLLRTPAASAVERRMSGSSSLHAPHLIDLEIAQVLRRYERAGDLSAGRAREALEDLHDLSIERYPHYIFASRTWSLRMNATAYDACYLALAEALDAPMITCDRRLAAVPGCDAVVEVIV